MTSPAQQLQALRSGVAAAVWQREHLRQEVAEISAKVQALSQERELLGLTSEFFRQLVDQEMSTSVRVVEELLSEGLAAVLPQHQLRVEAEVGVSHGKVSVDLMTVERQADGTITKGLSRDAYGGAVSTIQSILLRIIVAKKRGLRPFFVLDETLPAFDDANVVSMGLFLKELCRRMGLDILLVTHNPAMLEAADHAYRLVKHEGAATLRKIR